MKFCTRDKIYSHYTYTPLNVISFHYVQSMHNQQWHHKGGDVIHLVYGWQGHSSSEQKHGRGQGIKSWNGVTRPTVNNSECNNWTGKIMTINSFTEMWKILTKVTQVFKLQNVQHLWMPVTQPNIGVPTTGLPPVVSVEPQTPIKQCWYLTNIPVKARRRWTYGQHIIRC